MSKTYQKVLRAEITFVQQIALSPKISWFNFVAELSLQVPSLHEFCILVKTTMLHSLNWCECLTFTTFQMLFSPRRPVMNKIHCNRGCRFLSCSASLLVNIDSAFYYINLLLCAKQQFFSENEWMRLYCIIHRDFNLSSPLLCKKKIYSIWPTPILNVISRELHPPLCRIYQHYRAHHRPADWSGIPPAACPLWCSAPAFLPSDSWPPGWCSVERCQSLGRSGWAGGSRVSGPERGDCG